MKYKKLLIFITSLIFITTLAFSSIFVFKVAEINLTTIEVNGSSSQINVISSEYAKSYEGKNILFINSKKFKSELENLSGYIKVNKFEKVYPNKINLEIEERVEVFSLKHNGTYYVFDENLTLLTQKKDNINNVNYLPNIELDLNLSDYNENSFLNGRYLELYDEETRKTLNALKETVLERKENIKSIKINVRSDGKINRFLLITMTEGMEIQIDKSNERAKDKLLKLFEYYDACNNKGDTVRRYVTLRDNGEIVVV